MSVSNFLYKPSLICFVFLSMFLFSCNKPEGNNPPVDQLASYTRVLSDRTIIPELSEFHYFDQFLIDSNIYLVSSWINLKELKLAVIGLNAELKQFNTFYTLETGLPEVSVKACYDPERDYFYLSGLIEYDTNGFDSDPFFLVIDREGNIIHEKTYLSPGHGDRIHSVICSPGRDPVLVTSTDNGSSIGIYGQQDLSMVFLDHNFDSVRSIVLPFDSCGLDFADIPNEGIIRIIATKTDSAGGTSTNYYNYTHKFHAELDFEGNILLMERLPSEINDNIYFENLVPMNLYNWQSSSYYSVIDLQKYSESGSLLGSESIDLLPVKYPLYEHSVFFVKDTPGSYNFLYGQFYNSNSHGGPPVFHGNFNIKFDESGEEEYRVAFDEDLNGFIGRGPFMTIVNENLYVFLYIFYSDDGPENFYFSKVKVD